MVTETKTKILSQIIDKIEKTIDEGQGEIRVCVKNHYIYKVEKVETELYLQNNS